MSIDQAIGRAPYKIYIGCLVYGIEKSYTYTYKIHYPLRKPNIILLFLTDLVIRIWYVSESDWNFPC